MPRTDRRSRPIHLLQLQHPLKRPLRQANASLVRDALLNVPKAQQ